VRNRCDYVFLGSLNEDELLAGPEPAARSVTVLSGGRG
jgi:hypothetical protein